MKKILLSITLLAGLSYSANAQLPNGSTAPDFTATDINGVSHNLYTYLNAGKTVIIDVSATWCGPCWAFHNTHTLAEMYSSYGQGGSNEVVILFVEGDNSTTMADLQGNTGSTQGDWITGTPYPIIDNAGVANTLDIGYFPTVYRICPDKIITNISPSETGGVQGSVASLKSLVEQGCSVTLAGAQNHAQAEPSEIISCGPATSPKVAIKNFGGNAITSAEVTLFENGNQVATATFNGSIAPLEVGEVAFSPMTINSSSAYSFKITSINSNAPFSTNTVDANLTVSEAIQASGVNVSVEIVTDAYGIETTWELVDDAGGVVLSGGPYNNISSGSGTTAQPVVTGTLNPNSCYVFKIYDEYGDGIDAGYGVGTYKVKDEAGNVVVSGGQFTSSETKGFRSGTVVGAGINESEVANFQVYPNPANDQVYVTFESVVGSEDFEITLCDVQGRVLITKSLSSVSGVQKVELPVSEIAEGNYLVKVKSNSTSSIRSIIVK